MAASMTSGVSSGCGAVTAWRLASICAASEATRGDTDWSSVAGWMCPLSAGAGGPVGAVVADMARPEEWVQWVQSSAE